MAAAYPSIFITSDSSLMAVRRHWRSGLSVDAGIDGGYVLSNFGASTALDQLLRRIPTETRKRLLLEPDPRIFGRPEPRLDQV